MDFWQQLQAIGSGVVTTAGVLSGQARIDNSGNVVMDNGATQGGPAPPNPAPPPGGTPAPNLQATPDITQRPWFKWAVGGGIIGFILLIVAMLRPKR